LLGFPPTLRILETPRPEKPQAPPGEGRKKGKEEGKRKKEKIVRAGASRNPSHRRGNPLGRALSLPAPISKRDSFQARSSCGFRTVGGAAGGAGLALEFWDVRNGLRLDRTGQGSALLRPKRPPALGSVRARWPRFGGTSEAPPTFSSRKPNSDLRNSSRHRLLTQRLLGRAGSKEQSWSGV
jgi:hypothetical protein